MSLENIIRIIIQADDKATQQSKKVQDSLNKMGDVAQKANQKASQSSQMTAQKMNQLTQKIKDVSSSTNSVANKGSSQFQRYNSSVQDSIVKFNMLDKETQEWLNRLANSSNPKVFYELNSKCQEAVAKFNALDAETRTWGGSLDYTKSKLQLLGTNTDTLKGKIQGVGNAIPQYLGSKWDSIKGKVSSVGSHITSTLSSALSTVRSKIQGLGDAFTGLGGVISSVMGGIGLSQVKDMTIGLSMNREQVKSLMTATYGAGEATENLWNAMDTTTTQGLVSLDELSQSMSVIKMSTGASTEQLSEMMPVVNDIGQRAILMGRSGDEAIGLMQAAGKGLNGEFNMLQDNFGITKDKLESLGWDGSAQDVEGYTSALQKYLDKGGSMEGMLDTTSGKMVTLQKNFRIAGRKLGDEFLPYLDQGLDLINQWTDPEKGNGFAQYAIGAMAVASGFATIAPSIAPALQAFDNLVGKTKGVLQFLGLMEAEEGALTLATLRESAAQKVSAVTKYLSGVATATYGAIVGVLTGEIGLVTAATQIWNAVMAANPIALVVIALAALAVAIYEAGKMFGWWKDVGSMLDAIKTNVMRLWDAFINNPNVQGFIKDLGNAWNFVCESLQPVFDWAKKTWNELFPSNAGSNFDIVRVIIDLFGGLGRIFGDVVNNIKIMYAKFGLIGAILGIVTAPVQAIVGILRTVICALIGCSPGIVPALEKVQEVFITVWNYIVGFIGGIIGNVVSALQPVLNILTSIGNFLLGAFRFAWTTVVLVFAIVRTHINVLMLIFNKLLSGQISLSSALGMIWNTIKSMFVMVLTVIVQRVRTFALHIISKAIEAGRGFVHGIISFVMNLPGNIGMYLYSVVSRIVSAGASWISNATSQASSMVSGVINNVSQLPGRVGQEFMNIGSRIVSAGSDLVNKAKNIGKNIVDGLLGAMGIHSPGIIQTKVITEFKNMVGGVEDQMAPAGEVAREFGETMVDQFGDVDLTPNLGYKDLDMPEMNMNVGMDTSAVSSTNQMVTSSYNQLATQTGASLNSMVNQDILAYNKIKQNDANTLNQMVSNDKLAYTKIRQNDTTQLASITNNLKNKMNTMSTKVKTSMDNMINKNKTGLNSARNTTQTQLNNITSATTKANQKMVESWDTMKNGIVSAADKIKTDSTKHFDKLGSTIGGFYRKLQNPGGFGAGPGNGTVSRTTRRGSNGFRNIKNAIRKAQLPEYLTLGQIQTNPFISTDNFGSYITRDKNNKFRVSDLIRSGNIRIPIGLEDPRNKGAGSWMDGVPKHIQKIKDTSKNWSMKGPKIIGKYQTSHGFKVGEFMNGTPNISFETFKGMAEDVFGQTHYDFYYDDQKHGNWMGAFRDGYMNCYHGALALIAFANACGLSGNLVHGHWNQYGHFWANIAGHKMDVTGWQQQRNWTPAASHAGPGPKTPTFGDLIDELNNDKTEIVVGDSNSSGEVIFGGEFTIVHDFINLPEGISAEEVARLINDAPDDTNWLIKLIKKIVQDKDFQKFDLKEKAKIERRNKRALGV